jgi:hypothetical protein
MICAASLSLLAALSLAACGGGSASSPDPAATARPAALQAQCEAFFARARTCSEPYVAGLVDVRIELDRPPGIADRARAEGREPLVAQAMEEWETDSQPENVTRMCAGSMTNMPAEQTQAMSAAAERCMAETACDAFATCAADMHRTMIAQP